MSQRIRVDLQTGAISVALDALDTTITFGQVPDFPTLGPDEFVAITLVDFADVSLSEIVHLTAYTAGDFTGTIARAQEGPAPARAWAAGTRWDSAPTAEEIDEIEAEVAARVLRAGDTMTGPLVVDEGTDATIEVSSAEVRLTDLAPGAETRAMMSSAGIAVGYTDSGGAILTDAFMDPGGSIYAKASGQNYVELAAGAGRWTSTGKVYAPGFDAISTRITSVADGVSAQDAATVAQVTASAATAVILAPASSSRNVVQPTSSAVIPLVIQTAAAHSASAFRVESSAGTSLMTVSAAGDLSVSHTGNCSATVASTNSGSASLTLASAVAVVDPVNGRWEWTMGGVSQKVSLGSAAADVALRVRGAGSQTADLLRLQTSAAVDLWGVTAAGLPRWYAAGNEQTTVGAAGAASALPATPTKYLKVVDSAGTTLVVPAYAAA